MVIVVPSFSERKESNPPAIARVIVRFMTLVAKLMSGTINKPSAMKDNYQADKNAPNDIRPAAPEKYC